MKSEIIPYPRTHIRKLEENAITRSPFIQRTHDFLKAAGRIRLLTNIR